MISICKNTVFFTPILFLLVFFSLTSFSDPQRLSQQLNHDTYAHSKKIVAQNALPNLRFGSINIHSRKGTYDIIAFVEYDYSVSLYAENSGVRNVRVRAGIENGNIFYDKTFAYVSDTAPKRIAFTYSMPVGAHSMYIEVDPENTVAESNENDNRTARTFIANLRINVH